CATTEVPGSGPPPPACGPCRPSRDRAVETARRSPGWAVAAGRDPYGRRSLPACPPPSRWCKPINFLRKIGFVGNGRIDHLATCERAGSHSRGATHDRPERREER